MTQPTNAATRPPRTIYVKVSTEMLAELDEWSPTVQAKIERAYDDTYELIFRRVMPQDDVPGAGWQE